MANRKMFANAKKSLPVANTVNRAGGKAYSVSDENALAQYATTCTFNGTYYAGPEQILDEVKKMIAGCSDDFLIKTALYSRKVGKLKDMPAYILAELTARQNIPGLELHFSEIINNTKMLRNYVQIVRSGVTSRKSFGSGPKRVLQQWLVNTDVDRLFYDSVGDNPSLGAIIKLVHPKPKNKKQEALFGWLIGKEVSKRNMPALLKSFEDFKSGNTTEIPAVDFRRLTSLELNTEQWKQIGYAAGWNMIRMNLNTFARHGCFADKAFTRFVAEKLSSEDEIRKALVFPYQLFTTYCNIENVPVEIKNALQQAIEFATRNTPVYNGNVVVCVDTSGSMTSPITGSRGTATTKMKCVDVASLIASSILRTNKNSLVLPFDTRVHVIDINPFDSVTTNTGKLSRSGGGTDCSCALRYLNQMQYNADLVIYVSDNESWYNEHKSSIRSYSSSNIVIEWANFKKRNAKAKLACIDIQPGRTVMAPSNKDVLNIGGFSDNVLNVIANFQNNATGDFAQIIKDWYANRENLKNALDSEEEEC